jgi:hypothetical protein
MNKASSNTPDIMAKAHNNYTLKQNSMINLKNKKNSVSLARDMGFGIPSTSVTLNNSLIGLHAMK